MNRIVEHVLQNISSLNGTQWSLVAIFSLVIGYGLFRVLEWHYRSRYEAQRQLIDLKDERIEYYAGSKSHPASSDEDGSQKIVPSGWSPYLAQAFDYLNTQLHDAEAQQHMNMLSADLGFLADAELFITYVRLFETLPLETRKNLNEEQKRWLSRREKQSRQAIESHGGSLAPLEYNMTFTEETKGREESLRERLALQENEKEA